MLYGALVPLNRRSAFNRILNETQKTLICMASAPGNQITSNQYSSLEFRMVSKPFDYETHQPNGRHVMQLSKKSTRRREASFHLDWRKKATKQSRKEITASNLIARFHFRYIWVWCGRLPCVLNMRRKVFWFNTVAEHRIH